VNSPSTTNQPLAVLAFDFGLRRIGVAFGAVPSGTASALGVIAARDGAPDREQLDRLISEWQPDGLVVGLPGNTDGTASEMTEKTQAFGEWLTQNYQLPVEYVDERFTSVEAESILKEQRRSGARKRKIQKTDIDAMAAMLIAQSWLDRKPAA